MIFDTQAFAKKYAIIYTIVLAILLIVPLIVYLSLLLQIDETKVKLSLQTQYKRIIHSMQRYENKDKVYYVPRFKKYNTALYDKNYKLIFSNIDFIPHKFTQGFHKNFRHFYSIHHLEEDDYFNVKYILVSTKHQANKIYYIGATIMTAIIIALFLFSFLLLKNFSKPFEKLNSALDQFIKDSMHEINTPLSIINLNADLFSNKYGENKYLNRMKSASKTLATIYNDMDYLVKDGRVKHKKTDIDLHYFIQNRIDYFQEIANLKYISIETKLEKDIFYNFSQTKLQRIIDNTLSNAIKYSNNREKIEISLYSQAQYIIFEVKDYGVGIENIDKIFSRYYREDQSKGGFGIGLNIVKKIIDEENIKLEIHSLLKKGTTFRYKFTK